MLTVLESLNYSFRNPKTIIWVIYRIKQLRNYKKKNHGVIRGPQLGKQRWRPRLGILKVNVLYFSVFQGKFDHLLHNGLTYVLIIDVKLSLRLGIYDSLPVWTTKSCMWIWCLFITGQHFIIDIIVSSLESFTSTDYLKVDYPVEHNRILYSSVSQLLWDRGPVNSFFIRRGPGPNKFTPKYLSNFFF